MDRRWRTLIETSTGETPVEALPVGHGANNRLFRIRCESGLDLALKLYPTSPGDERDRLGAEVAGLSFLTAHGVTVVPKPLGQDDGAAVALFQWIDGEPVASPTEHDIDGALAFVATLKRLSGEEAAAALPEASEACLSFATLTSQIEARYEALLAAGAGQPALADFLQARFRPRLCALLTDADPVLSNRTVLHRTLSPSDFGFHNALRRRDGSLAFVDFEYFGWDDPVKLVSDFVLHPGMSLSPQQRRRFLRGCLDIFSDDPEFAGRLDLSLPFYALRWCMILLNEFLPERWRRRQAAGIDEDREDVQRRQLLKAERWLILSHDVQEWTPP